MSEYKLIYGDYESTVVSEYIPDSLIREASYQSEGMLNDYQFYDSEWTRFCSEYLINQNEGIVEKTRKIQTDERHSFRLDNGLIKNIAILDKRNIHNNRLQVLNQYEEVGGNSCCPL